MVDLQRNTGRRWKVFNNVFLVILLLIVFFAFMDSVFLKHMFALDSAFQAGAGWSETNNVWNIFFYNAYSTVWMLWLGILGIIAIVWYLVTNDKSESLALFIVPAILIIFGTQDLLYFAFSPQTFDSIGCWADIMHPVRIISDLYGEGCPTKNSFVTSGLVGLVLATIALFKLKYLEPRRRRK